MLSDYVNKDASDDTLPGMGVHNNLCTNCDYINNCNRSHPHEMTVYGHNQRINTEKRYTIYVTSEVPLYFPMDTPLKMTIQLTYSGKIVYMTMSLKKLSGITFNRIRYYMQFAS